MDSRFAQKIVDIAKGEVGKVSDKDIVLDLQGKPTDERKGWENLKKYFEEAGGFTAAHWNMKGLSGTTEITFLDGVKLRNKRVPQKNMVDGKVKWSGTHWCGIFASWCWIKAGVPQISWSFPGVAVKNKNVLLVPDFRKKREAKDLKMSDLGLGDIAILNDEDPKNPLVHHCVVTKLLGESFECVNGNSDYQGILTKTLPRTRINSFYTYRDFISMLVTAYPNITEPVAPLEM